MMGKPIIKILSRLYILALIGITFLSVPAAAHTGGLALTNEPVYVPIWLFIITGGAVISLSFLIISLATDREFINNVNSTCIKLPQFQVNKFVYGFLKIACVFLLIYTILMGFIGPKNPISNFSVLFVWVIWWAGYTMTVYLFGNTWDQLNPWKTISSVLPSFKLNYPLNLGSWPASLGLIFFVLIEVGSNVTYSPISLSYIILFYTIITLMGSFLYGHEIWFKHADPLSKFFQCYGNVSLTRSHDNSIYIGLPGMKLIHGIDDIGLPARHQVLFIITILFITTYDGLVSTQYWVENIISPLSILGFPILFIHLIGLIFGHLIFYLIYHFSIHLTHKLSNTYISIPSLSMRFAVSLLPIAAGYHIAHYIGYILTFFPSFISIILFPIDQHIISITPLPLWFSFIPLAFILLGHMCSVWISHCISFKLFSGRLQPLRSQYPLILVMVLYTMFSLWIISAPLAS